MTPTLPAATPAPWEIVADDFGSDDESEANGMLPVGIVGPDNACVLRTTDSYGVFFGEDQPDGATAWANARLIVGAPSLFAALCELIALVEMDDEACTAGTDLWMAVQIGQLAIRDAERGNEQ